MKTHGSCLLAFTLLTAFALGDSADARQAPEQSVYVVARNHYSEGVVGGVSTVRFGDLIMIEIHTESAPAASGQKYVVGQDYALFMGGEHRGNLTIDKVAPFQCESTAAVVSAREPVVFSDDTMALATSLPTAARSHPSRRRVPTVAEVEAVKELAVAEFRKHGVPEVVASRIQARHVVVAELDSAGRKSILGEFLSEINNEGHDLLLIAPVGDSSSTPQLSRYDKSYPADAGLKPDFVTRLVDQLDLDADGRDEIVIEVQGYESLGFVAYRQQENGLWSPLWEGGESGC